MDMARAEAQETFAALQQVKRPRQSQFPLCTVNSYEGGYDASGAFHGSGTLTSSMGFTYTGTLHRGQVAGRGRVLWADGYAVDGAFSDGVPNGCGTITWPSGDVYRGDIRNGVRHGRGVMTACEGAAVYEGEWAHGVRCGQGRQRCPNGAVYEGQWEADMPHGRGTLTYATGDCYDGEWAWGVRQGYGVMGWMRADDKAHRDGGYAEVYDGQWHEGVPHGAGQSLYITYASARAEGARGPGGHQVGEGLSPSRNELPSAFAPPADAVVNAYRGTYARGQRSGWGAFFYADGSSYEGHWEGGKKNGTGTFTNAVGIAHHGLFVNDTPTTLPLPTLVNGAGPAAVPTVNISDLRGVGDGTAPATEAKIVSLLLRFNTALKTRFHAYSLKADDVSLAFTPRDWWRRRVPGHISLPQLLRLLSDAGLIDGLVTISAVLGCAMKAAGSRGRPADEPTAEASSISSVGAMARCNGWLNYCEFVETLIRVAPTVCLGVGCGGGVCDSFRTLVEEKLKGEPGCVPLCPLTRHHLPALAPLLDPLEGLYQALVRLEHDDTTAPSERFLSLRSVLRFVQPLLEESGIGLHEAACAMHPFARYTTSAARQLPPGFNAPGSDKERALAQERFRLGCGVGSREAGHLLVSGVLVDLSLSLVEFVEAVVALAIAVAEKTAAGDVRSVVEARILPLPV